MSRLDLTPQARLDLLEIGDHIAQDRPRAAVRVMRQLHRKCRLLAARPYLGAAREELAIDLRSFSVGNYLILYRPAAEGVQILRIVHGARDLEALFPSSRDE